MVFVCTSATSACVAVFLGEEVVWWLKYNFRIRIHGPVCNSLHKHSVNSKGCYLKPVDGWYISGKRVPALVIMIVLG